MKSKHLKIGFAAMVSVALLSGIRPAFAVDRGVLHLIKPTQYSLTFSGLIACEGQPVAGAEVNVVLHTHQHPDMKIFTKTQSNGIYSITMSMEEFSNSAADWKVTAQSDSCQIAEIHGSNILTDDADLVLAKSFDLDSSSTQLALR